MVRVYGIDSFPPMREGYDPKKFATRRRACGDTRFCPGNGSGDRGLDDHPPTIHEAQKPLRVGAKC